MRLLIVKIQLQFHDPVLARSYRSLKDTGKFSRREWMLAIFRRCGAENSRNTTYQFWRQDNHPEELYSPGFSVQKMDYIHNNPVVAGLVDRPKDYLYSSARDYWNERKEGLLEIEWL